MLDEERLCGLLMQRLQRRLNMQVLSYQVVTPSAPMVWTPREETPGPREVLVAVEGCGVCHTDLGFFYDGVPTRHPFPLTLGHEVSGRVVATGPGAEVWMNEAVIVPAVIPCGTCPACRAGRGTVCPQQVFPGSDLHGGFGTHLRVPAHGLCPVPDLNDPLTNPAGLTLADLSVIADAVSTPYQAIVRSELQPGDLAIFIGAGGIGGFGVQLAAAMGAHVIAIDVNEQRLSLMAEHGATLGLRADALDFKALRQAVQHQASLLEVPSWRTVIFETSGTAKGQELAFGLLGHGSTLMVVGFTSDKVQVRLSNLMAFDARAMGNWGCLPEHYPAVLQLVLSGAVQLRPFVEHHPLSAINDIFPALHERRITRRVILQPAGGTA